MTSSNETARPVNVAARFRPGYEALSSIEAALRTGPIPKATLELIKIRSSQLNGCAYCLDMHHLDALAAGETQARLYLLPAWREAHVYTPAERAALALAEAITLISVGHVPADVEAEARVHYDDNEYAALVFAVIVINGWNRMAIASHTQPGNYTPGQYS
jgi:AhpD family alkylhydroperoxidase